MLRCKVGNKILHSYDYEPEQFIKWADSSKLKCPDCDEQLLFKNGVFMVRHFSHKVGLSCKRKEEFYERETSEHETGKLNLFNWIKNQIGVKNAEMERYIQETRQRPDIYFEQDGHKYAIEYQCSPLGIYEYEDRHRLYECAGIKDIWIFGTEKYSEKKLIEIYGTKKYKKIVL